MKGRDPRLLSLRAIRKASHISSKAAKKGGHLMDRIESRTTRMITHHAGAPNAADNIGIDELIYSILPQTFPVHPALPEVGQKPSVTVFAFLDPRGFYGGIATLLCVGATLANKLGYDFRVAQTTGFSKDNTVLDFLAKNGIIIEKERFSTIDLSKRNVNEFAYLPLHPDDVVVVSAWWDAHVAAQLPLKRKFLYLIQDYEPIFYNNGDSSVLADQTYYTEKFIPLCNTEILGSFFASKGYDYIARHKNWFEPAPAPDAKPSTKTKAAGPRKLFLYGRPQVHRNLFFNAIKALDIVFSDERMQGQEWELYCAGSADVPAIKLHSGHVLKNMGKMDLAAYYKWASTVDVAMSPMLAPHPNYPTLELASLGAMVVSTKWETKQNLDRYSKNIIMAEPSSESMAEAIIAAALTTDKQRLANLKKNNINTDWVSALDQPIQKIADGYIRQK